MTEHVIDGNNQSLGRLASRVAFLLRGKANPAWRPNIVPTDRVKIINAAGVRLASRQPEKKMKIRYTGYPGGLKSESLTHLDNRQGREEVIRQTVRGMLPANSHRVQLMKHLTITV